MKLCNVYDQISQSSCRYYEGHGGRHYFARLDRVVIPEQELRRALDQMTAARDAACDLAETVFRPGSIGAKRVAALRKVGA